MKPKKIMEKRLAPGGELQPSKFPMGSKRAREIAKSFPRTDGGSFRLKDVDPVTRYALHPRISARQGALAMGVDALAELQDMLYAQDRWAVLVIFQAMDAAGKDGAIKHVMSGINPQGCQVYSFKSPSSEDLDHDFLWRCLKSLPERGRIGIFNRSYYEEVLVVRVHPEFLAKQRVPPELVTKDIWKGATGTFRRRGLHLARNGVALCKVFLHVSRSEQKKRSRAIGEPWKYWKFSANDAKARVLGRLHGRV